MSRQTKIAIGKYLTLCIVPILLYACTNDHAYDISFCTKLTEDISCANDRNNFRAGDRVYAMVESEKPFTEKVIISTLYIVGRIKRGEISTQKWTINPGDNYAYDYVDFVEQSQGTYEFEFTNESGDVLASEKIEIQ